MLLGLHLQARYASAANLLLFSAMILLSLVLWYMGSRLPSECWLIPLVLSIGADVVRSFTERLLERDPQMGFYIV